jgi:hypothetical protein
MRASGASSPGRRAATRVARSSASRAPGSAAMSTMRVVLTAAKLAEGPRPRRRQPSARTPGSRGSARSSRRRRRRASSAEGADVAVEPRRLELRRERQRVAAPVELRVGDDGPDLGDDLLDGRDRARRVVDRGSLARGVGGEEERARDVGRVVVLRRAGEADRVRLPLARRRASPRSARTSCPGRGPARRRRTAAARPRRGRRRPRRRAPCPRRRASRRRRAWWAPCHPASGAGDGSAAL